MIFPCSDRDPHFRKAVELTSAPLTHLPTPNSGYRLFQLLLYLPPSPLLTLLPKELRFHSRPATLPGPLPVPTPSLQDLQLLPLISFSAAGPLAS